MKKILEVLRYGDNDIRFNTDLDIKKNPNLVPELVSNFAFAMTTSLWGGNEIDVLAIIRALAIADLGVRVNRKEMVRFLDEESACFSKIFNEAIAEMQKREPRTLVFGPGVNPPKMKS